MAAKNNVQSPTRTVVVEADRLSFGRIEAYECYGIPHHDEIIPGNEYSFMGLVFVGIRSRSQLLTRQISEVVLGLRGMDWVKFTADVESGKRAEWRKVDDRITRQTPSAA